MKIKSKSQMRFFGAVASGRGRKKGGPSKRKAALMLKENRGKMRGLPTRAPKRSSKRSKSRSSYR